MKIQSLLVLPALVVLSACAGSSSNVRPDASGSAGGAVTFKSTGKPAAGTRVQRTEHSTLQMTMVMENGGMRASMPMTLTERSLVDVEALSDARTKITFREKMSTQQMGEDAPETQPDPVHGKTYVVDGTNVRDAEGRVVEGEEASTVSDENFDDEGFPGGEVSFEKNTELPLLADMVTRQFGASAGGGFDARKVSVQLVDETADAGIFRVELQGMLTTPDGVMDLNLVGRMEMTRDGMRMRNFSMNGPIRLKVPVQSENGPIEVVADGTMAFESQEKSLN